MSLSPVRNLIGLPDECPFWALTIVETCINCLVDPREGFGVKPGHCPAFVCALIMSCLCQNVPDVKHQAVARPVCLSDPQSFYACVQNLCFQHAANPVLEEKDLVLSFLYARVACSPDFASYHLIPTKEQVESETICKEALFSGLRVYRSSETQLPVLVSFCPKLFPESTVFMPAGSATSFSVISELHVQRAHWLTVLRKQDFSSLLPDATDVLLSRAEAFQRARLYDPFYTFQLAFESIGGDLEMNPVLWDPRVIRILGGLSIEAALSASVTKNLVSFLWYLLWGIKVRGMQKTEVAYVASLLGIRVDEVPEMIEYASQLDYDEKKDTTGRTTIIMSPVLGIYRQALIDSYDPYSHFH